jgi:hypothetical protein
MESKLDPAATIIDMCGGIDATAAIVGCNRSTVYRWMQPDGPRDGTGGIVPLRYVKALLQAAPALTPGHFVANIGKPQNGKSE